MITAEINYWAVLVSVLAVMAIGAVWYSPAAFGRQWAMLSGRMLAKNSSGREMNRTVLAKTVLLTIIMVYTLAHFIDYTSATTVGQGALTGIWLWLGFVATTSLISNLYEARPMKLWHINTGYPLLSLIVAGAILAAWV